jgi:hypothetical protein
MMNTDQHAQAVVWIASYPKSGNTWLQTVVRHAGKTYGFPNTDLDVYKLINEKRAPQVVRGVRPRVSPVPTAVLKTHAVFRNDGKLHPELGLKTAGFVYVMRNPLDMLLSYINFTRQQYGKRVDSAEYQKRLFIDLLGFDKPFSFESWQAMTLESIPRFNLDHALTKFTDNDTNIPGLAGTTRSSWLEHCRSWHGASSTMPSVILRYEDLLQGASSFFPLTKVFRFTSEQISEAVEAVNTLQHEKKNKQVFFNKMTSFYFREFFSPTVVSRFLAKFEAELKTLGYGDLY